MLGPTFASLARASSSHRIRTVSLPCRSSAPTRRHRCHRSSWLTISCRTTTPSYSLYVLSSTGLLSSTNAISYTEEVPSKDCARSGRLSFLQSWHVAAAYKTREDQRTQIPSVSSSPRLLSTVQSQSTMTSRLTTCARRYSSASAFQT